MEKLTLENGQLQFHITYDTERLSLSELINCLKLIEKSIKVMTKNSKRTNLYNESEPFIERIANGSILATIILPFFLSISADVIKEILVDVIKNYFSSKINPNSFHEYDRIFEISVIKCQNGFSIKLHIHNLDFKW